MLATKSGTAGVASVLATGDLNVTDAKSSALKFLKRGYSVTNLNTDDMSNDVDVLACVT